MAPKKAISIASEQYAANKHATMKRFFNEKSAGELFGRLSTNGYSFKKKPSQYRYGRFLFSLILTHIYSKIKSCM